MPSVSFNTAEFDKAVKQAARQAERADAQIVTENARAVLQAAVDQTPHRTGGTRAGYTAPWRALRMPGSPPSRLTPGRHSIDGQTYVVQGSVSDKRRRRGNPEISWTNSTYKITSIRGRIDYVAEVEERTRVHASAFRRQFRFGPHYDRILRRASG